MSKMSKGERGELLSLIKKRERVMKSQTAERSAALLAEFDAQSAKIYHYDDDATWAALFNEAQASVDNANQEIAKRAKERGIPAEFCPSLSFGWHGRGHNAVLERRAELRRAAKSKIEALEKEACAKIEALGLQAQTEIVASGLDSERAKAFLDAMPKLEKLMPPIDVGEIQTLVESRAATGRRNLLYDYDS